MIPVVDLRSLWASFLANPASFGLELLTVLIVTAVAIVLYRKTAVKYRIPLVLAYLAALLIWTYWPLLQAADSDETASTSLADGLNCITRGANSPIVIGENSAVVIDGKTYAPGQSANCEPESTHLSTHGVNSPIITGKGSTVIIHTER